VRHGERASGARYPAGLGPDKLDDLGCIFAQAPELWGAVRSALGHGESIRAAAYADRGGHAECAVEIARHREEVRLGRDGLHDLRELDAARDRVEHASEQRRAGRLEQRLGGSEPAAALSAGGFVGGPPMMHARLHGCISVAAEDASVRAGGHIRANHKWIVRLARDVVRGAGVPMRRKLRSRREKRAHILLSKTANVESKVWAPAVLLTVGGVCAIVGNATFCTPPRE
jgi:hypothetical protein